jgi:hypothetical protein
LINDCLADQLSESKLKSVTYSLNTMIRILEVGDLESRVEELEKQNVTETKNPQVRATV